MSADIDLWTGTYTDTDDDTWAAFTYEDDAVQFIHMDDQTEIWQGRTVYSTEYRDGRAQAHYSESTGCVYVVLATSHMGAPEMEATYGGDAFAFDPDDLDEDTLERILQTILAEWAGHHGLSSIPYPSPAALDTLSEYTTGVGAAREKEFSDRNIQEIFTVGVANIASQAHS